MKKEKRQRRLIEAEFLQDFANKKAGDYAKYEPSLACNLLSRGVAKVKAAEPVIIEQKMETISKTKKKKKNEKDNSFSNGGAAV